MKEAYYKEIREKADSIIRTKNPEYKIIDPVERVSLIKRRTELGLSQKELAEIVGVSVNTICSIEKKMDYDPKLSLVKAICTALDDTAEHLFWD